MHDSVTVHIAAPPERVWALVSDDPLNVWRYRLEPKATAPT